VKHHSITNARNNFASLVRAAEEGRPVVVTRRGMPVAVVLSFREYEGLSQKPRGFAELYRDFLRRNPDLREQAIEPEDWLYGTRDSAAGRGSTG
jgi:prevent-host-death family protein